MALALSNNQLTTLSSQIRQLTTLTGLYLHKNPGLGMPDEALGPTLAQVQGRTTKPKPPQEILDYYFVHHTAAQEEGTEPLMEAKVLVLGEASVGKSCLIAALSEGKRRHELDGKGTSGIVRKLWLVRVKGGTLAANPKARGAETPESNETRNSANK